MYINTCVFVYNQLNRNTTNRLLGTFLLKMGLRNFGPFFFGRVTQVISSTNLILGAPRWGIFSWAESLNAPFPLRFNTRATKYLAKNGWHDFFHWYDYMSLFAEIGVVWRWLLDDIAWPFYAILCSFSEISAPRKHRYILLHAGTKHLKACALPIYNMIDPDSHDS